MYTLRKGGSYDRFIMMLEAFLDRQCEVHCLSLTPIPIRHPSFQNHVICFPFRKVNSFIARFIVFSIFPIWAVWIGWRNRIDLIIAFGSLYAFLQCFAKWLLNKSMITLIRGGSSFGLRIQNSSKWILYLNKFTENVGFHFSDRIITNNVAARDEILNNSWERKNTDVQVLYNNIPAMNLLKPGDILETRDRYGIPADAKVLVTAGILNRGKNIESLVKCLSTIKKKNLYVVIAGDSSTEADLRYKDFLHRLVGKLGVDKQVLFTGWLDKEELWKIYLASDLFVLPSLSEGMPNVLLEAIGLDLPCLGSRIPGVVDILQYEELLFDPYDDEALAEKVNQFFSNENVGNRILKLSHERKKAFDFDWKERAFQMVTKGTVHRGEACQSR
jgi:glycosyltransferase involved in cell wall biosynthesis